MATTDVSFLLLGMQLQLLLLLSRSSIVWLVDEEKKAQQQQSRQLQQQRQQQALHVARHLYQQVWHELRACAPVGPSQKVRRPNDDSLMHSELSPFNPPTPDLYRASQQRTRVCLLTFGQGECRVGRPPGDHQQLQVLQGLHVPS